MSELGTFETRFAAAYRRYLDEVPTEVDAAAVVRTVTAAHPGPRAGAWSWSLRPAPALAWLVLLALLLAALGAAAFFIGSQRVQRLPAVIPPVSPTATHAGHAHHRERRPRTSPRAPTGTTPARSGWTAPSNAGAATGTARRRANRRRPMAPTLPRASVRGATPARSAPTGTLAAGAGNLYGQATPPERHLPGP